MPRDRPLKLRVSQVRRRQIERAMTVSIHPGMGALAYDGGVAFRVWAPFASSVSVAGTFNGWSPTASPLAHEGGGYWSTDVAAAVIRDEYKFVLTSPFQ